MRKLENRESITVGVMAIALLYGAFSFMSAAPAKKASFPAAEKAADLQALTSDVTAAIGKDNLSVRDAYVIARAETEWLQDPFMEKRVYREMTIPPEEPKAGGEPKVEPKKVTFSFTGFMEFRGKQIAIINGTEYTSGEALDPPGYVLRSISREKVKIENQTTRLMIEVPLQDW